MFHSYINNNNEKIKLLVLVFALSSCGGGGGGGGSADTLPLPTISFSTSINSTDVNTEVTLTWSSTNSSSCSASGDWSGSKAVSGSELVKIKKKGDNSYSLSCTGDGGSLSRSFDFETLIKCAKNIKNININFIICGDGELKKNFIESSKGLINIKFTGWIDRNKISAIESRSNVAIAPYKKMNNFKDNIPNKIIDYISFGLPILSPLKGEVATLIKNKL